MANRSYRIGYAFERRVMKFFEKDCLVFRQGKSKFPDLICIVKNGYELNGNSVDHEITIPGTGGSYGGGCCFLVECKVNKFLSKEEKEKIREMSRHVDVFVAYRKGRKLMFYQPMVR